MPIFFYKSLKIQQKLLWLLSNVLRQTPYPSNNWYEVSIELCKITIETLTNDALELISNILLDISYIPVIINTGMASFLLSLESCDEDCYFDIIYSLTAGNETDIQYLIENNTLKIYSKNIRICSPNGQESILQGIYNISLGPPNQVHSILLSGLVNDIIFILKNNSIERCGLCIDILSILCGSKAFLFELFNLGVISIFIECLKNEINPSGCIFGLFSFINSEYLSIFALSSIENHLKLLNHDNNTAIMVNALLQYLNK